MQGLNLKNVRCQANYAHVNEKLNDYNDYSSNIIQFRNGIYSRSQSHHSMSKEEFYFYEIRVRIDVPIFDGTKS